MWWRLQKLLMLRPKQHQPNKKMLILVSGCDSGLGLKIATTASNHGLTVVAGLLKGPDSEAGRFLKDNCPPDQQPHLVQLDITDRLSVSNCVKYIEEIIKKDPQYFLHAVINNAGVMIFGKFEWQTEPQIESQLSVNVMGTWRLSRETLPLLRESAEKNATERIQPRLITLESHCAIQPLPLLSIYGATKFALKGWREALAMELKSTGVKVVSIIPGSFPTTTSIADRQKQYTQEMKNSFDAEKWEKHKQDFDMLLTNYLDKLSFPKKTSVIQDDVFAEKVMSAILDKSPDQIYKHQPWRYAIYHFLFGITPSRIRHWLVEKFVSYPQRS